MLRDAFGDPRPGRHLGRAGQGDEACAGMGDNGARKVETKHDMEGLVAGSSRGEDTKARREVGE